MQILLAARVEIAQGRTTISGTELTC